MIPAGSFVIVFLMCGLSTVSAPALAEVSAYRCKHGIVRTGDTTYAVRKKCGAPTSMERVSGDGAEQVEEYWVFDQPGKMPQLLKFKAGILIELARIEM